MKSLRILTLIVFLVGVKTIINAQSVKSPNLESAKLRHKTMAVVPVFVTETDKTAKSRKENKDGITTQDENEGLGLQGALIDYFITKKPKNVNLTVEIQEKEITNSKLAGAGITWLDIQDYDKAELCKVLGVDAVMYVEVTKMQNLTKGGQAAIGFFTGVRVPTGNVTTVTNVFDGETGENLWNYTRKIPTDYWTSAGPEKLADNLMKKIVKEFPWVAKKAKK